MEHSLDDRGTGNKILVGENITLSGFIEGDHNTVSFAESSKPSHVHLFMSGDNNVVQVARSYAISGLVVTVGSHVPAHNTRLEIGENFSIEHTGAMMLYTSGGHLAIGEHCMFSSHVTMRCGESPHLLFDKASGTFLDAPKGVSIGNHVWVGEHTYMTKSASVTDECVVGACSVVTKTFSEPHCVIAGNPAKVVRRGVQWIRNKNYLEEGSRYAVSHDAFHARYPFEPSPGAPTAIVGGSANPSHPAPAAPIGSAEPRLTEATQEDIEILQLRQRIWEIEQSTSVLSQK